MKVLSGFSRRITRIVSEQVERLDRVRQEVVAGMADLLRPKRGLVPVRVVVDRQRTARSRD